MAQGKITSFLCFCSENGCGFLHTERRVIFQVTGRASVLFSVLIVGAKRMQHGKGRWDSLWWGGALTPRWVRGGTPRVSNNAQNHSSTLQGILVQKSSSHLRE